MIAIARKRAPELAFTVGSMLDLLAGGGTWAGAVALYSTHLADDERARACEELARVLEPNGWLLPSFHVDSASFRTTAKLERLAHPRARVPEPPLLPARAARLSRASRIERVSVWSGGVERHARLLSAAISCGRPGARFPSTSKTRREDTAFSAIALRRAPARPAGARGPRRAAPPSR